MTDQLRFNQGKPRDSYFWSNPYALFRMSNPAVRDEVVDLIRMVEAHVQASGGLLNTRDELYTTAVTCLSGYVGHVQDDLDLLAITAWILAFAVEQDLDDSFLNDEFNFEFIHRVSSTTLLLDTPTLIAAYGELCEYGERKYERGNYRKGAPITQYCDSTFRHLRERLGSEIVYDPESECLHGIHAFWNVFNALEQPDWRDDRLPAVQTQKPGPVPVDGLPTQETTPDEAKLDFGGAAQALAIAGDIQRLQAKTGTEVVLAPVDANGSPVVEAAPEFTEEEILAQIRKDPDEGEDFDYCDPSDNCDVCKWMREDAIDTLRRERANGK